jgi:hypothetical protein
VVDYYYAVDQGAIAISAGSYYFGGNEGFQPKDVFFFGHVHLNAQISGIPVLTDENRLRASFISDLKGRTEFCVIKQDFSIGAGLDKLGTALWMGSKRLYAVGFNKFAVVATGLNAGAAFFVEMEANGIFFLTK